MSKSNVTRRAFLATATTSVALTGCATKVNTARVVPGKVSPMEKVNVAGIGVGGMGRGDIMGCTSENVVGLCDVDWDRAGEAFYKIPKAKQYKDYRVMLEEMDSEIDAVTVSTPDHTHAPAAYMAMKMGKHVRVQKPLTHTIKEARLLADTAKEMGVITQMGNQGHSGDGVRDLCEMLWSGAIGEVREAHAWTNRPVWPQGIDHRLAKQEIPETMDWDLWLGTAPVVDYNKAYAPFNWRGWWDYGCGAIGDMACHIMDPVYWSLRLGEAPYYSVEVVEQDGMNDFTAPNSSVIKFEFPERAGGLPPVTVYWYDGKVLPPRPESVPADQKLGEGNNGSFYVGSKGVLTSGCYGGESRLMPDEKMKDYKRPPKTIPRIPDGNHTKDWLNAIKQNRPASSDFSYAGPLTEVANMGNVALFAGEKIVFDVAKCEIVNVKSANKYLTKEYRAGFDFMPL